MTTKTVSATTLLATLSAVALLPTTGCFTVKTENEIKPIHITMDINLKVDKELDKSFADENQAKPKGDFAEIKKIVDRKAAGFTAKALLEARDGATDDDKITIAEANAKRMKKFADVAKDSGVSIEAVQRRYAKRIRERIPAGTWYQDDDGKWLQK